MHIDILVKSDLHKKWYIRSIHSLIFIKNLKQVACIEAPLKKGHLRKLHHGQTYEVSVNRAPEPMRVDYPQQNVVQERQHHNIDMLS